MKTKTRFGISESNTLANCCRAASDKFRENAETFRKLIDYKPHPDAMIQIHGAAAQSMAEMFDNQAYEAAYLASIFENCDDFVVEHDEEDE